jgi:tetratricopeptide (TPR) repeat protein
MKSIFFLGALACSLIAVSPLRAEPPAPPVDVKPLMRQNFETLMELQAYAASPERFRDPKNYAEINKLIDRLSGIAHVLPQVTNASNPGLSAVAGIFSEYLNDLKGGLKTGNPIYLRNRIRTAAGFCFECHTSTSTDKSFPDAERRVASLNLTSFQKADYLAATRQFDKALDLYDTLLGGQAAPEAQSTELAHAVRNALILAVRVKEDPKRAAEILDRVDARKDLSAYFRHQIDAWRKDVSDWKKEKPMKTDATAASWLEKAQKHSDHARSLQSYLADHAGDVSYLRAMSCAQQALMHSPDQGQKAHAFYLLGAAHAVLGDPLLWDLGGYYFEACVEAVPHTPLAQSCFDRWLQETTFGYSGSLGAALPPDLSQKTDKLRNLAQ